MSTPREQIEAQREAVKHLPAEPWRKHLIGPEGIGILLRVRKKYLKYLQDNMNKTRKVRTGPRTFEHYPEESTCPICGTNDDGVTVLVRIAGTAKDGLSEAQPMHLDCAVVTRWGRDIEVGYTTGQLYRSVNT